MAFTQNDNLFKRKISFKEKQFSVNRNSTCVRTAEQSLDQRSQNESLRYQFSLQWPIMISLLLHFIELDFPLFESFGKTVLNFFGPPRSMTRRVGVRHTGNSTFISSKNKVHTQIHGLFQFATFFQFPKVANWKCDWCQLHWQGGYLDLAMAVNFFLS